MVSVIRQTLIKDTLKKMRKKTRLNVDIMKHDNYVPDELVLRTLLFFQIFKIMLLLLIATIYGLRESCS
jgi:hypothetical protein